MPGGMTVDAVHRSVLLRFPTAAEEIADAVALGPRAGAGRARARATPATRSCRTATLCRDGLGRKAWTDNPPTWHVQAWALRQAWIADTRPARPSMPASTAGATGRAMAPATRRRSPSASCSNRRSCRYAQPRRASTSRGCSRPAASSARPGRACAGSSRAASCCARSRPTTRAIALPAMPTNGRCRPAATACALPRRA